MLDAMHQSKALPNTEKNGRHLLSPLRSLSCIYCSKTARPNTRERLNIAANRNIENQTKTWRQASLFTYHAVQNICESSNTVHLNEDYVDFRGRSFTENSQDGTRIILALTMQLTPKEQRAPRKSPHGNAKIYKI